MTEFTSGSLVFKNVPTLGAAHTLASQMARLSSDVHIIDVGFLVKGAWAAAWFAESKAQEAANVSRDLAMECVQVSPATMNAIFSLGPTTEVSDTEALIVEADEFALGLFFQFIEASLKLNWKLLEIRLRKSGPAGAHAFLVGPGGLTVPTVPRNAQAPNTTAANPPVHVVKVALIGDYRRYF